MHLRDKVRKREEAPRHSVSQDGMGCVTIPPFAAGEGPMTVATDTAPSIDAYIARFPPHVQERLRAIREAVHTQVPEATERISYTMPAFVLNGNLVLFAAWTNHIALYPVSTAMETAIPAMAEFPLSGKGTIQFPHDRPLPLALIRDIIAFRLKESTRDHKPVAAR
jgi:uncharacterized protein YdhG (YjbR/CyaY superfamily)